MARKTWRHLYRKEIGSIDDLVGSMASVGLIHPVIVDADGNLIAGERRLMAALRLGWKEIPTAVVDLDDDQRLRVEHDENTVRKNFTPSEAVAIRNARLAREKAKAKERQAATQFGSDGAGNFPGPSTGHARDKAADGTGYSGRTLDKAAAVMEAAAADPSLTPVVQEMDATGKVDPAYRTVSAKQADTPAATHHRRRTPSSRRDRQTPAH